MWRLIDMFPACYYLCENERYIIYITMPNRRQPAFYNWLLSGNQLTARHHAYASTL